MAREANTHASAFDAEQLETLCRWRTNVLLTGPARRLNAVLARMFPPTGPSPTVCSLPGPLKLPSSATRILLRDVAALTRWQQRWLLEWMDHARMRVQIISATSKDLFNAVRQGEFSRRLYYRLSTVRVDV